MQVSKRIEKFRQTYVHSKPLICYDRADLWTRSHQETEGEPIEIRRAKAFLKACSELPVNIFEDELLVGTAGRFRRTGILTPEFSWKWVDKEMDTFESRPQDPYVITSEQRDYVRENIFPYWKGKSLEEAFLSRVPESTARILIDTGIIDNDSKWRQAIGEITPDYLETLFPKGYDRIRREAEAELAQLEPLSKENIEKIHFYQSVAIVSEAIVVLAARYGDLALEMEKDDTLKLSPERRAELREIARVCTKVPAQPPETFREAIQFMWFVQLGGVISENPLALNPGRFDQYMYPFYAADLEAGRITESAAQELIEALWIKLSEWVWTISANTADFFAGYNQFQNLTVGGKNRDGSDATNAISYMCLKATERVKTHQPGLSVRIHADCPEPFMNAVVHLVKAGTGFPAIHNDDAGSRMLLQAGYEPEDARDWNNCGCVVPHFRKTGQWTAAVNVNFGAALEYALNEGNSRLRQETLGVPTKPLTEHTSFEEIKSAFETQLQYLIHHSVIGTVIAQQLHSEMVPRPFLSTCVDGCFEKGKDLSRGGAKYNVGPVLTGIGLGVVANSLVAIKKLVFDEKVATLQEFADAMKADWEGFEALRKRAMEAPKYGNDLDEVDRIAQSIANFYYHETRKYKDIFGSNFNTAFMGISNYIPAGKVVGATPCGRKARTPLTEGVSPFVGTDVSTPLAAMRSAAKMNHDVHTGGTLLNLRLMSDFLDTKRGVNNLKAMIRAYFSLGAFHVQFNTVSNDILRQAQARPEDYRDLLVRVAGYSTQFVNLSSEVQEAIMARNAHGSV
jgi:formate C-acetyltransferase